MKYKPLSIEQLDRTWPEVGSPMYRDMQEQCRRANALAAAAQRYSDRVRRVAEGQCFFDMEQVALNKALAAYLGEGPDSEGA